MRVSQWDQRDDMWVDYTVASSLELRARPKRWQCRQVRQGGVISLVPFALGTHVCHELVVHDAGLPVGAAGGPTEDVLAHELI